MINFFVRNSVRRLLKRKESDADGRALSELQASTFSDLLQRRTCSPSLALSFNFFVSVGIIMMNKLVLGTVGFNYPIYLTFIHYMVSWVLMSLLNMVSLLPSPPPSKTTPFSALIVLALVMSTSTGLANVSQMAKIAVTPTIVLAEFMLFRKTVTFHKVAALTVVSAGVAVATVTDLEFRLFGACVALAWIIPSAANKVLWSSLQQRHDWTALALMWKTTPMTVLFLLLMIPLLDPPGGLSFKWTVGNSAVILLSAFLGFLLQFSGALALGATSAVSHVVLGQFKTCVILLAGFLLFNSNPGLTSIFGAGLALAGMSAYTYLSFQGSRRSKPGRAADDNV